MSESTVLSKQNFDSGKVAGGYERRAWTHAVCENGVSARLVVRQIEYAMNSRERSMVSLDELVLRCRTERAKSHISEAVACYRSRAFRACVVTSWIAVVYDFIDKLRELELSGDNAAKQLLEKIETFRSDHDLNGALEFERNVLALAQEKFELLTPIEFEDLERLRLDRHRCAHPSLQSVEQIYSPTAELARTHLRNAVDHMLAREPVQGKAALDRLFQDLQSDYFPTDKDKVLSLFRHGPLARPSGSLLRNFIVVLLKKLLLETTLYDDEFNRVMNALGAVMELHPERAPRVFENEIQYVVRSCTDDKMINLFELAKELDDAWAYLPADVVTRLDAFVDAAIEESRPNGQANIFPALMVLIDALSIDRYRIEARDAVRMMGVAALRKVCDAVYLDEDALQLIFERAMEVFSEASDFRAAKHYISTIMKPLVRSLSEEQMNELLAVANENDQIYNCEDFPSLVAKFTRSTYASKPKLRSLIEEKGYYCEMSEANKRRLRHLLDTTDEFLAS